FKASLAGLFAACLLGCGPRSSRAAALAALARGGGSTFALDARRFSAVGGAAGAACRTGATLRRFVVCGSAGTAGAEACCCWGAGVCCCGGAPSRCGGASSGCGAAASCCGAPAACCGAAAACCGATSSCCGAAAACWGATSLLLWRCCRLLWRYRLLLWRYRPLLRHCSLLVVRLRNGFACLGCRPWFLRSRRGRSFLPRRSDLARLRRLLRRCGGGRCLGQRLLGRGFSGRGNLARVRAGQSRHPRHATSREAVSIEVEPVLPVAWGCSRRRKLRAREEPLLERGGRSVSTPIRPAHPTSKAEITKRRFEYKAVSWIGNPGPPVAQNSAAVAALDRLHPSGNCRSA